ncbi:NAD(P)-binding domain-containing protein, partial [Thermus sp.]|uniref:NAD(P)-binding domain-containing protein n=1 Tax=Thermus sp. TaxID=275 RepID=UPI0039190880
MVSFLGGGGMPELSTTSLLEELKRKIATREAVVGVVGLGYVGLPFAVEKAKVGFRVIGVEQNPRRAEKVNRGENYIPDVRDEDLKELVARGLIRAETDFRRVPEMDVIVIAVPTPLTQNLTPDLRYVVRVTEAIAEHLRPGQLISLESTTYPGTTEEVMLP